MSALPKINGARNSSSVSGTAYDELRNKVAALVRPERITTIVQQQAPSQPALRPSLDETAPVFTAKSDRPETARDPNSVFEILSRATSCFDLLNQKLEQVEGERDELLSQIEEHKRAVTSWQEMIETVQARMQDAERDMAEMRKELAAQQNRANAAEEQVAQLDSTLNQRERRLSEIEHKYINLYDQVMSSFGLGSSTQRILENLVQRFNTRAA